jgi:hypothetical protein
MIAAIYFPGRDISGERLLPSKSQSQNQSQRQTSLAFETTANP